MARVRPGHEWWRHSTIYQIYPKSFADSNADGVGDLRGIIDHVDYLVRLGVGAIWLSPIYRSPQDDNGYDIADYYQIDPVFGTMDDFDELLEALHTRGIRLIMDTVVNHTSDEHPWFAAAKSSTSDPHRDWYIWRDGFRDADGTRRPPTNWGSFFSGPTWTLDEASDQYYLHLFSPKQPDLNWENPELRAQVYKMMNWWADRGVDGFRMDVINFISKNQSLGTGVMLPNGFEDGAEFFSFGPRLREYLGEARAAVLGGREGDYLVVGETPGATPEQALTLVAEPDPVVDMVFQFEHMDIDQGGATKWDLQPVSAGDLARSLVGWQNALGTEGWNSLYLSNHDQPRPVSRFGDPEHYPYASATALATMLHLMRGTPYVFQGEELGALNPALNDAGDLRDIESINFYRAQIAAGRRPEEVLQVLRRKARDNARSPMPWSGESKAGFTTGEPWAPLAESSATVNVAEQLDRPDSVFAYYRRLIDFRKNCDVVALGDFTTVDTGDDDVLGYLRRYNGQALLVLVNLTSAPCDYRVQVPDELAGVQPVLTNVSDGMNTELGASGRLRPWEARVYQARLNGEETDSADNG